MAVTEEQRAGSAPTGSDLATELVAKARAAFEEGEHDRAFDYLDKAVSNTADPGLLKQINDLAHEGYDQAGFFARHTMWGGLIKATEHAMVD